MNEKLKKLVELANNNGYKASWGKTKDNQRCVIINNPNKSTIFAFKIVEGRIVNVGYLKYTIKRDNKGVVDKLEVDINFRYIGLGRNMMLCLQEYCMEMDCNQIELKCTKDY